MMDIQIAGNYQNLVLHGLMTEVYCVILSAPDLDIKRSQGIAYP